MKVREAKVRLDSLKRIYDNALKIHDYCPQNAKPNETVSNLEEKSGIDMNLGTFASCVATIVADERKRTLDLIDNAEVNIN